MIQLSMEERVTERIGDQFLASKLKLGRKMFLFFFTLLLIWFLIINLQFREIFLNAAFSEKRFATAMPSLLTGI